MLAIFFAGVAAVGLIATASAYDYDTVADGQNAGSTAIKARGKVAWPKVNSAIKKDPEIEKRVAELLAGMSLKEKVGQIIQAEIKNISPQQVSKYHIGSVLSAGGSYPSADGSDVLTWVGAANRFHKGSVKNPRSRAAIPIIWGVDAVHGHNNVRGATIFPHNIGLGATGNPQLIKAVGEVTAREVAITGIRWTFAPTAAVARDDRWGRTYESYSENPELVAELTQAMVVGLQGNPLGNDLFADDKVVATVKHFIGDGGTASGTGRDAGFDQGDTVMDEQTLMDIHGQGYFTGLAAGAQTVMASFSSWNGEKMHGSKYMLTDVLKGQMGFDGFVVGDWNGHDQVPGCSKGSCPQAINAGVDLIMVPELWLDFYKNTLRQVKDGVISEERLDDAVTRILRVKMRAGLFDGKLPSERRFAGRGQILGHPKHRAVAQMAVRESLVLLKHENSVLPIKPTQKVFVTGEGADNLVMQSGGWSVSWQGDNTTNADFPGATSIYSGIKAQVEQAGGSVELGRGAGYKTEPDVAVVVFGEQPYAEFKGDIDGDIVFANEDAGLKVVKELKAKGIPVVTVFLSGRPLWVNRSIDASDAFIAAWLPGSEGQGVADVILANPDGSVQHNFVGKLSFSWPERADQTPLNIGDKDYQPKYSYGYGLTYK